MRENNYAKLNLFEITSKLDTLVNCQCGKGLSVKLPSVKHPVKCLSVKLPSVEHPTVVYILGVLKHRGPKYSKN